jgi:hypothetical protein
MRMCVYSALPALHQVQLVVHRAQQLLRVVRRLAADLVEHSDIFHHLSFIRQWDSDTS